MIFFLPVRGQTLSNILHSTSSFVSKSNIGTTSIFGDSSMNSRIFNGNRDYHNHNWKCIHSIFLESENFRGKKKHLSSVNKVYVKTDTTKGDGEKKYFQECLKMQLKRIFLLIFQFFLLKQVLGAILKYDVENS